MRLVLAAAFVLLSSPAFAQTPPTAQRPMQAETAKYADHKVGFKGFYPGATLSECQAVALALGGRFVQRTMDTKRDADGKVISLGYLFDPMLSGLTMAETKVSEAFATFLPGPSEPVLSSIAFIVHYDEVGGLKEALALKYGEPKIESQGLTVWKQAGKTVCYSKNADGNYEKSSVLYNDDELLERIQSQETAKAAADL